MKAQHLKQHLHELEIKKGEDAWGNQIYTVEGVEYKDKQLATAAVRALIDTEFRARFVKQ